MTLVQNCASQKGNNKGALDPNLDQENYSIAYIIFIHGLEKITIYIHKLRKKTYSAVIFILPDYEDRRPLGGEFLVALWFVEFLLR